MITAETALPGRVELDAVVAELPIRLLQYNVAVWQPKPDEKTKGGLIKPDLIQTREKHMETVGVVVGLSALAFSHPDVPNGRIKGAPGIGDRVIWAQHAGIFVKINGQEYRVIKDEDIVAVIDADAEVEGRVIHG